MLSFKYNFKKTSEISIYKYYIKCLILMKSF